MTLDWDSGATYLLNPFTNREIFLQELYNAALDLWKVERRLPLKSEASSPV